MAKMSANKTNNGNDRFSSDLEADLSPSYDSDKLNGRDSKIIEVSIVSVSGTNRQADSLNAGTKDKIEVETELTHQKPRQKTAVGRIKARTAAMLIGSAVMLPILATGTATYYFGNRAIERQTILAKGANNNDLAQTELARAENLLGILLIGTGITALLAGSIAAWTVKRLLDERSAAKQSVSETEARVSLELSGNLDPSVLQQNILEDTVEEVRSYLKCDRAIVYSLNQDNYGEIVAESVAVEYPRALGKTISDPCLAAKYLPKYRKGKAVVIDDLDLGSIISGDRELNLEIKANLAVPIVNENKLLGLLVAHQYKASREWQQSEIGLLQQLAHQTGLAGKNAELQDNLARLQAQADRERQWTNHFTDAVRHIHQSIARDDVLEISVEEVRRVLKCDRVLVYSQDKDKYGVVVAESVAPGYPRALNKTIEVANLDRYHDGKVGAIDNIYEVGMSQDYLEQLETLQVKANLVAPIYDRGQLLSLLVAHQCSACRHWLDYEIRWMSQIATQVGFAIDNARVLVESAVRQEQTDRERQWTNYFTDAVRHIHQSIARDDVLEISVEEVRRVLKCDRVVVYSLERDKYGVVVAESVAPGYPRALNKTIEVANLDRYRDGKVGAIDNIYEVGMSQHYLEQLETLQVKANLVAPIYDRGQLLSLLVAHQCSASRHWLDYEIRWMSQIATQVGFALNNATLLQKLTSNGSSLKLLNDFSFSLGAITDRSKLLKVAVEQARQTLKLDRAIIYQFDLHNSATIAAESVVTGYSSLNSALDDSLVREYYRDGIRAIANITSADLTSSHLERLKSLSVQAILAVPISQSDRIFGLLVGHQCQQPRSWSPSEIDLFTQLAVQLGFALERIELQQKLDLAKNIQPEPQKGDRPSKLIIANEATLQVVEAYNEPQLIVPTDLIPDIEPEKQTLFNGNLDSQSEDLTAAGKAISKALDEVEMPKSLPNIDLAVGLIDNTPDKIESDSTSTLLPIGDIIVAADKITLEPVVRYNLEPEVITGQLIESSQTKPNSVLMNQFVDEMSDLSERISQQSLFVTESFQKLAEFAKQLSEREK